MVYGLGNAVIKFLFFSANLLICVFGGLIFGFSLWANLDKNFAVNLEKLTKEIHQENLNMLSKVGFFSYAFLYFIILIFYILYYILWNQICIFIKFQFIVILVSGIFVDTGCSWCSIISCWILRLLWCTLWKYIIVEFGMFTEFFLGIIFLLNCY